MSIIGSDKSGPRIQCSGYKESGCCSNASRFYIQKIEQLVVDALRIQLKKPKLIEEYVKAYREERNRLEKEARNKRGALDREFAKATSEIQRIVGSIAKGVITDDEAGQALTPLRAKLSQIELDLASAATDTKVVELHPQAVKRFRENLEALAIIVASKGDLPDLEISNTFRALVEGVVVQPRKAGEEYQVNIRGYLASLMGIDQSALVVVAREGLEPPTPGL